MYSTEEPKLSKLNSKEGFIFFSLCPMKLNATKLFQFAFLHSPIPSFIHSFIQQICIMPLSMPDCVLDTKDTKTKQKIPTLRISQSWGKGYAVQQSKSYKNNCTQWAQRDQLFLGELPKKRKHQIFKKRQKCSTLRTTDEMNWKRLWAHLGQCLILKTKKPWGPDW